MYWIIGYSSNSPTAAYELMNRLCEIGIHFSTQHRRLSNYVIVLVSIGNDNGNGGTVMLNEANANARSPE
jgi:hypothetical protein